MFADTALIRALGSAHAAHAADLSAAAALVWSTDTPASALGPVGADFVAALRTALTEHSAAITALSVQARAAAMSAAGTAADFDAVGRRAADLLPWV
ncbi:hypothetical protein A5784_08940 [Mycobacterium sp. 852013-50091_SCH5140682]|uniref:hypothetical protein n=1 Tax=Mycobacterium sp. 852013-50091_SCH5140682 TaxID=1834109 RepID=UPI0007E97F43|nr:hypothetical protein [Mycobacterium sp. 852013-50091_SCH5140682]OBC07452.1 hypothetical protein A5784_08940 [Mycobacterium sp. 852013-50091_SCH5140682]